MDRRQLEKIIEEKADDFGRAVGQQLRRTLLGILDELEAEGLDEEMEAHLAEKLRGKVVEFGPRPKNPEYPKCAYPGCNKNRFPRGKGFCGEHWKQFERGEIEEAGYYKERGE